MVNHAESQQVWLLSKLGIMLGYFQQETGEHKQWLGVKTGYHAGIRSKGKPKKWLRVKTKHRPAIVSGKHQRETKLLECSRFWAYGRALKYGPCKYIAIVPLVSL